jgi:hypothetical protein
MGIEKTDGGFIQDIADLKSVKSRCNDESVS